MIGTPLKMDEKKKDSKFEVKRQTSMSTTGYTLEMLQDRTKAKRSTSRFKEAEAIPSVLRPSQPTSVYLYLQLQKIVNAPTEAKTMKVRLQHNISRVNAMRTERLKDEIRVLKLETEKPTFTIRVDQDSVDELNSFADCPMRIMLYENFAMHIRSEEEEEEQTYEEDVLIAEGYIDLLQFFTKKRPNSSVDVFLYPTNPIYNIDQGTCKMSWQIYSLMPLLKNLVFTNMVFITFESIYNVSQNIIDIQDNLRADLYFQSKIPDKNHNFNKVKICHFSSFISNIIADQNPNTRWESLTYDKKKAFSNVHSIMSMQAGVTMVPTHKLLKGLLSSEELYKSLHEISINEDVAISCNTMRRYILTAELTHTLEDVIAFNEQHILLELYHKDNPSRILLRGSLDLSIFLYPKVNSCRFAVALHPPPRKIKGKTLTSRSNSEHIEHSAGPKIPFAVLNICLVSPITEKPMERRMGTVKINTCQPANDLYDLNKSKQADKTYKDFDDLMQKLIDYLIENDIKTLEDCQKFCCGQLDNISNKILKLVQYDFNVRYPTKTNIEFNRLMTIVYKDLMERVYNLLEPCNQRKIEKCASPEVKEKKQIVRFMTIYKYLVETNEKDLCEILLKKLQKMSQRSTRVAFFMMLHDLENLHYAEAKKYFDRPVKEKYALLDFYAGLISIYINYMELLEKEKTFNEALQCVLIRLKAYSEQYPSRIEPYILLYCFYKSCRYAPGMSYARWKYENLYGSEDFRTNFPVIPNNRWCMYHCHKLTFQSLKGMNFYKIVRLMTRLGMFKFAEMIYNEIASESGNEFQKYLMTTTFRLLLKDITADFKLHKFSTDNEEEAAQLQFLNGSVNFYRGNREAAVQNYENIIQMKNLSRINPYRLGLLRYGFQMIEREEYDKAIEAFKRIEVTDQTFIPTVFLGKIMYKLNRLKEAESYFAAATRYQIHIPDVWAYIALINLKLGHMYKALESWKYARIHPDAMINDEILEELQNIDPENLAAQLQFLNGSVNFYRGNREAAVQNYENIIQMKNLSRINPYRLGLLRYGFQMIEREEYDKAIEAFKRIEVTDQTFIPTVFLGKIMYKLNRLKEAESYFAAATRYQIHIPDVWAYIALINLKLGHMYKALESWKYARIHPDAMINDEILEELQNIDPENLVLYVDKPYCRRSM